MHVCDVIVANDMCVGCGTCAAMCPAECLHVKFTPAGESAPDWGLTSREIATKVTTT